jgi:hypothetical protein
LDADLQAVLNEASARITGDIDHVYLGRENARLEELARLGAEISGKLTATRAKILLERASAFEDLSPDGHAFRAALDNAYQ